MRTLGQAFLRAVWPRLGCSPRRRIFGNTVKQAAVRVNVFLEKRLSRLPSASTVFLSTCTSVAVAPDVVNWIFDSPRPGGYRFELKLIYGNNRGRPFGISRPASTDTRGPARGGILIRARAGREAADLGSTAEWALRALPGASPGATGPPDEGAKRPTATRAHSGRPIGCTGPCRRETLTPPWVPKIH